jgi:hypothetical protein
MITPDSIIHPILQPRIRKLGSLEPLQGFLITKYSTSMCPKLRKTDLEDGRKDGNLCRYLTDNRKQFLADHKIKKDHTLLSVTVR